MVPVETCARATVRARKTSNKTLATFDVLGISILQ
jgi:hypothetical protein